MRRDAVELDDARRVQGGDRVQARDTQLARPAAGVDEDELAGQFVLANRQRFWSDEARLVAQHVDAWRTGDAPLAARAKTLDDVAFALSDADHVDLDRARAHAVVGAAAGQVGDAGASDHGFGRCAALVDARSADVL